MKCPIDQTDLVMSERHGIEIDYCPQCRGVWLDRGELDKIIERAAQLEQQTYGVNPTIGTNPAQNAPQNVPQNAPYGYDPRKRYDDDDYDDDRYRNAPQGDYRRKRRSFLDDVFDIFD